jgi:hypothetical protein
VDSGLDAAAEAGYYVVRYIACARGCGGCRIEYSDGTVKQYGCSCEMNPVLVLMEKVRVHRGGELLQANLMGPSHLMGIVATDSN